MGRKTRAYSRVAEASEMITKICEKHPKAFWAVTPASIAVMGVDNIERSEKAVASKTAYLVSNEECKWC